MPGRRWLPYIALLAAAASLACGDIASPTSPIQKRTNRTAPVGASYGRYILISGVSTCVEDCGDDGSPSTIEGLGIWPHSPPLVGDDTVPLNLAPR